MNASIDFDTAKNLSKFLSDKLRAHPGTHQPAKLLHWVAEFQGFRNARALKAASPKAVIDGAQAFTLSSDPVDHTVMPGTLNNTDTNRAQTVSDARTAMVVHIRSRMEAFFMAHRDDLREALRVKFMDTSLDVEAHLYQDAWDEIPSFFGEVTYGQLWAARLGLTNAAKGDLIKQVRDRGLEGLEEQAVAFMYEEATKDVLVTVLRDLNTTMESEVTTVEALTDVWELRERIKKAADDSLPAWMGKI